MDYGIAPRAPYGATQLGMQRDNLTPKGMGFMGEMVTDPRNPKAPVVTEYSLGASFPNQGPMRPRNAWNSQYLDVPSVVPTLNRQELHQVTQGQITPDIQRKAETHALDRMWQGKSPFAGWNDRIQPYPSK